MDWKQEIFLLWSNVLLLPVCIKHSTVNYQVLSASTDTTGGTTGSGGLSTDQKIEIGVPVGCGLLGALVTILVATGIFKCRKRCLGRDPEQQPLIPCECVCVCVCM